MNKELFDMNIRVVNLNETETDPITGEEISSNEYLELCLRNKVSGKNSNENNIAEQNSNEENKVEQNSNENNHKNR